MFHQSGGCCERELADVLSRKGIQGRWCNALWGEIRAVPFYMSVSQFAYWKHTQLIVDVVPRLGGISPRGPRLDAHQAFRNRADLDNTSRADLNIQGVVLVNGKSGGKA
jgi:uncharacterized protein (DUF779 family)